MLFAYFIRVGTFALCSSVWAFALFGKKLEKFPYDSAIYNTYKNELTVKRMI